jgi:hypothetical protein
MGIITLKATPVSPFTSQTYVPPGFPTTVANGVAYNWVAQNNQLGDYDIGKVWADLPGPYAGFNNVFLQPSKAATVPGTVTSPVLPAPILTVMPGQIITAWEPTLGWGEFIALRNPVSNALPVGTLVQWDATYSITTIPVKGTSQKSGVPVAVAISSAAVGATAQALTQGTVYPITPLYDGSGLASQANQVTIAWYQLSGRAWTLKTAVQITPNQTGYISGTAGRIYVTASAGGAILGSRVADATTTSTQSLVLVNYANRGQLEGT